MRKRKPKIKMSFRKSQNKKRKNVSANAEDVLLNKDVKSKTQNVDTLKNNIDFHNRYLEGFYRDWIEEQKIVGDGHFYEKGFNFGYQQCLDGKDISPIRESYWLGYLEMLNALNKEKSNQGIFFILGFNAGYSQAKEDQKKGKIRKFWKFCESEYEEI